MEGVLESLWRTLSTSRSLQRELGREGKREVSPAAEIHTPTPGTRRLRTLTDGWMSHRLQTWQAAVGPQTWLTAGKLAKLTVGGHGNVLERICGDGRTTWRSN